MDLFGLVLIELSRPHAFKIRQEFRFPEPEAIKCRIPSLVTYQLGFQNAYLSFPAAGQI